MTTFDNLLLSMSKDATKLVGRKEIPNTSGLLHYTILLQRNPSGFGKGYRYSQLESCTMVLPARNYSEICNS